ncbi:MAG TPA: diacylglycerol kinase family protein [Planctomycetota bacterium]
MPFDCLIIANPTSGARAAPELATRVKELLRKAGRAAEIALTTGRGDALRLAGEAAGRGVPVVAGCGGDGTLQEIATALDGSKTALGILPRGRCNDFASVLGLGKQDSPEKLADVLLNGARKAVDLGAFGEKRFLTVATMGFDSQVSRFVETRRLWLKGTPAYLYGVLRVLISFRAPLVRLKGDFGEREGRLLLVATGNAPCYGGAMRITPEAKLDDGVFHLCVVDEVSRFTVMRILPRVLRGTHVTHPAVTTLTSTFVEIETPEQPQWVCADGESLGQTPCRFDVRPKALHVLVPSA